jgi:(E)-4-hydroxy-3-methylbut-2-enyl-diphosphate synthase
MDSPTDDNRSAARLRNPTRAVRVGSVVLGGGRPVVVQSMCATKTCDIAATSRQADLLSRAGAGIVRIAVDTRRDAECLAEICRRTEANLSVDLQENYRLAAHVAPWVDKIRYNPGHLYHHEKDRSWQDKVAFLVDVAGQNDCALRIGVNCGSVDPAKREKYADDDSVGPMLESALDHAALLDRLGFSRYCVSLKDSDPGRVIEANRRFAAERPDVPLHLGVTEAGMPPEGIWKTRLALDELLAEGIGDTIRVSLTVPNDRKTEEVEAGLEILEDLAAGRRPAKIVCPEGINIISCPSCSRVENEAFVELAAEVRRLTRGMAHADLTIAVMGCRVNGPGETDHADLGLWCGPKRVTLKRRSQVLGSFDYTEILARVESELRSILAAQEGQQGAQPG